MLDLHQMAAEARDSFYVLASSSGDARNDALRNMASVLSERAEEVFAANREDMAKAEECHLAAPLLHRNEIRKLDSQVMRQGYTLIPLEIYFKDGKAKLQLGLCKGKQIHDKRDAMAKRDSDREIQRAMRNRQKDG